MTAKQACVCCSITANIPARQNVMNTHRRSDNFLAHLLMTVALVVAAQVETLHAASGQALVRSMTGQAVLVIGDAPAEPLPVGASVPAGAVIKTGVRSAVDLFLGENVGTVRLTQNTIFHLDKLSVSETDSSKVTEIQLTLDNGTVVGSGSRAGYGTTYQIKVSNGVAAVGRGLYRIDARGYVVLLEGSLIFAHVPVNGEPQAHELKAPPPVYFSPVEGIRRAPPKLTKEVEDQWKAKLSTTLKRQR
jgi:hypothetical protein